MKGSPNNRKPTQNDVAKAAGVSQALVSLVFTNAAVDIAESTRARIFEVADQLGYQTSSASKIKRNKVLAYIRPVVTRGHYQEHWVYDSYDHFYDRYQNCFVEETAKAGYSLIVKAYSDPKELTRWLIEWGVDGIIWHAKDPVLAAWIAERYPMVQINRHEVVEADAVSSNQTELISLAMDHLRTNGHERIVHISTQAFNSEFRRLRDRAYLDYTEKFGLPNFEKALPLMQNMEMEKYIDLLLALLEGKRTERPSAVIAGDGHALPIIKLLAERGWQIPEDLSFVGIDNISASAFFNPALTTLDTRHEEIARLSVIMLLERIKNRDVAFQKVFVTPKLIVRDSVASPSDSNSTTSPVATGSPSKL